MSSPSRRAVAGSQSKQQATISSRAGQSKVKNSETAGGDRSERVMVSDDWDETESMSSWGQSPVFSKWKQQPQPAQSVRRNNIQTRTPTINTKTLSTLDSKTPTTSRTPFYKPSTSKTPILSKSNIQPRPVRNTRTSRSLKFDESKALQFDFDFGNSQDWIHERNVDSSNSFDNYEVRILRKRHIVEMEGKEQQQSLAAAGGRIRKAAPEPDQEKMIIDVSDEMITIEENVTEETFISSMNDARVESPREDLSGSILTARRSASGKLTTGQQPKSAHSAADETLRNRSTHEGSVESNDTASTDGREKGSIPPHVYAPAADQPTTSRAYERGQQVQQVTDKQANHQFNINVELLCPPAEGPPMPSTPKRSPMKRSNCHPLSPTKAIKRTNLRTSYSPKIKTYVFFDFEATSLFPEERGLERSVVDRLWRSTNEPRDYTDFLDKALRMTTEQNLPRITQMAFCAIPRLLFESGIDKLAERANEDPDASIWVKVPCNVISRVVNPSFLATDEWAKYNNRQRHISDVLAFQSRILQCYHSFDKEWPQVLEFLKGLPKPAVLIAHNGLMFDMRVLYFELKRYGFLDRGEGIPEDIFFVDSILAAKDIESEHRKRIDCAIQTVDFASVAAAIEYAISEASNMQTIGEEAADEQLMYEEVGIESEEQELRVSNAKDNDLQATTSRDSKSNPEIVAQTAADATVASDTTPLTRPEPSNARAKVPVLLPRSRSALANRTPPTANRSKPLNKVHSTIAIKKQLFSPMMRRSPYSSLAPDHPLHHMRAHSWPAAIRRRIKPEYFVKRNDQWVFDKDQATRASFALGSLYQQIIKTNFNAHYAQDDAEALMLVMMAYGQDFVNYVDKKAADVPF